MIFRQPLGKFTFKTRDIRSANKIQPIIFERRQNCLIPRLIDFFIVVDEANQIASRSRNSGVERGRPPCRFSKTYETRPLDRCTASLITAFVSSVELLSTTIIFMLNSAGILAVKRLLIAFLSNVLRLYVGMTTSRCILCLKEIWNPLCNKERSRRSQAQLTLSINQLSRPALRSDKRLRKNPQKKLSSTSY